MTLPIIDTFLFNGEWEVLHARRQLLQGTVTAQVCLIGAQTFSGVDQTAQARVWVDDLHYAYRGSRLPLYARALPTSTPVYRQERGFGQEYAIRNHLGLYARSLLPKLLPEADLRHSGFLLSDADEIPDPTLLSQAWDLVQTRPEPSPQVVFRQLLHYYSLNLACESEPWYGSVLFLAQDTRPFSEIILSRHAGERWTFGEPQQWQGWHWSYLGGVHEVEEKILSSTHPEHLDRLGHLPSTAELAALMAQGKDLYGREMTFRVRDPEEYPAVLRQSARLHHLWREYVPDQR